MEVQLALDGMPALPPATVGVVAAWAPHCGWTIRAHARAWGSSEWAYSSVDEGSPLTTDELLSIVLAVLETAVSEASTYAGAVSRSHSRP